MRAYRESRSSDEFDANNIHLTFNLNYPKLNRTGAPRRSVRSTRIDGFIFIPNVQIVG